jgi:GWxTD domain-containing protein
MKKAVFLSFLLFFLLAVPLTFSNQVKKSPEELPEGYRKWLKEEVVYIITPKEKEVFLQLESDKERNLFIEAFWKQRDPIPRTPENEYKKEHYRRISYANQRFGKEAPGPGWRSDMGKIYITLGEPKSIERFENLTEVYPTIIWFYEGMVEYGLPNAFSVVFFRKDGIGEYELYSPIKYGPQHLLIHYKGDPQSYLQAYNQLLGIQPAIADISLSLIQGESSHIPSPSIASEVLLNTKIPAAPHKKVEDSYAEKLLKYKDIIEVDYTANYMDSDSYIKVIKDKSGIYFVHYLIEPKKLSLEQFGSKFYTNLEINGKISDLSGNTIYQFQRTIPIELNEDQLNRIKGKLFSFQDMFPLIGGNYRFDLLLKNQISKEFTSLEKDISIPTTSSLQMSPLTLANKIVENSKYSGKNKPFLIENIQLVPSPRNDFSINDTLYLFFQIYGLDAELRESGKLEYTIFKNGQRFRSLIKEIKDYPDQTNFLEEFSLENFSPDNYRINVSLLDKNKEKIIFEQSNFYISPFVSLPRPWVLSFPLSPSHYPLYSNILGNQFLNKKDIQKAKTLLENSYQKNPASSKFALDFIRLLLIEKEYQRVKQISQPFLETQEKFKFFGILGQSCQALGEYEQAISHYKDYLAHYGTNIYILNSIGECYYSLGNKEEALIAWEKSLELNPNQEELKKFLESIKEKQ